ncbi:MAG: ECF-type sigma factor [Pseudomonadota bacterium]|nr:ECF-type sigma factor [Pseudomonadota bacterium]
MDRSDVEQLITEIYGELREQAARLARRAGGGPTPSSLVHDAVLRLYRRAPERWTDERHFRATAALALKQVLIDGARRRGAEKRGGNVERAEASEARVAELQHEIVQLGEVLAALEAASPRTARVVALKVLGELENEEIADALGVSRSTVDREWRGARALLGAWGRA